MKKHVNKKRTEKVLYGSVAILRGYCSRCKTKAFVIDERLQCCGKKYPMPDSTKLQRETEGKHKRIQLPAKLKKKILEDQENKCIYCDHDFDGVAYNAKKDKVIKLRMEFDHVVSWQYSRDDSSKNIVASCQICNSIKGNKYFYDWLSAREYILERREEKGY